MLKVPCPMGFKSPGHSLWNSRFAVPFLSASALGMMLEAQAVVTGRDSNRGSKPTGQTAEPIGSVELCPKELQLPFCT